MVLAIRVLFPASYSNPDRTTVPVSLSEYSITLFEWRARRFYGKFV